MKAQGDRDPENGGLRGAWLDSFEFKEFEEFDILFRHAPTLRVAADLIAQRAVRRAG